MPIRPEMRHLYPTPREWRSIRECVLARAGNVCETCKVPNRIVIERGKCDGRGVYLITQSGRVFDESNGQLLGRDIQVASLRCVEIVLTVAHLDHDPTNNVVENLRALCQQCHLRYDRHEHAKNAASTRARKRDACSGQLRLSKGAL